MHSPKDALGRRVSTARERLGWSREALAFHSGLSWSAVAQVESGRRTNLRPDTLQALAGALGVTIDYLVTGSAAPVMLDHRMLPYAGEHDFVEVVGPVVEESVTRSEPVLAVTTPAVRKRLEDWLGAGASDVEFADRTTSYRAPGTVLRRFSAFLDEKLDAGFPWVRIIGEPVWESGFESHLETWMRYESFLNLAFRAAPVTIACIYDTSSLDPAVVEQAHLTHPRTIEKGRVTDNSDYVEPGVFLFD
jgi:transcriptional regulator with XRE-family HTH domain